MFITFKDKKFEHKFKGTTVRELLDELKIQSNTVIVTSGEQVLLDDSDISTHEKIDILSVISGG